MLLEDVEGGKDVEVGLAEELSGLAEGTTAGLDVEAVELLIVKEALLDICVLAVGEAVTVGLTVTVAVELKTPSEVSDFSLWNQASEFTSDADASIARYTTASTLISWAT